MNFRRYSTYLLSTCAGLLLAGCSGNPSHDTVELSCASRHIRLHFPKSAPELERAILLNEVSNTLAECTRRLSLSVENSEISSINSAGYTVRMPVSRDTFNLLLLAQEYNRKSGGVFDITTAPIACLWGFYGSTVPEHDLPDDVLRTALQSVGHDNLRLYKNTVELTSPYARLNLDEMAKAYAIDLAILKIRRLEYGDVLLESDGAARALGKPSKKADWTFSLLSPFDSGREVLASIHLANLPAVCVAQTGNDFVTIDGKRYGHHIDPRTGRPAEGMALVAVLAPTTTKAFALAEALFVLGPVEGMSILPEFSGCEALFIPDEMPRRMLATRGMADALEWPEPPVMPCQIIQ